MKTTGHNPQSSNFANGFSSTLSRIGLKLAMACLCGLALPLLTPATTQAQLASSDAAKQHPTWAQVPGELIRPDCVHEIPHGARVEIAADGSLTGNVTLNGQLIAHYDACSEQAVSTRSQSPAAAAAHAPQAAAEHHKDQATGNGWVEDDQWNAPLASNDNIDYMAGNWTVPAYPNEQYTQVIYLSNGIEPSSHKWFLEAALEYGYNGVFGGNYYVITTFLIGTQNVYYSTPEYVNPGDSLSGFTQTTGQSGSKIYWDVVMVDNTSGVGSEGSYWVSGQHWTWAYAGILQAYNTYACAEFPASGRETFYNSVVAHGFPNFYQLRPNWIGAIPGYGGPNCHFSVVAASATLNF